MKKFKIYKSKMFAKQKAQEKHKKLVEIKEHWLNGKSGYYLKVF